MNNNSLFIKAYASIGSGVVGRDIFTEYFPFLATVLLQEGPSGISFDSCAEKITQKFQVKFSPSLVEAVAAEAVRKGLLTRDVSSVCYADPVLIKEYAVDFSIYEKDLSVLAQAFKDYLVELGETIGELDFANYIEQMIEQYSIYHIMPKIKFDSGSPEYLQDLWQRFVIFTQDSKPSMLDIIVRISVAVSKRQALFYSGGEVHNMLKDLSVYFDTKFIMHIIGADGVRCQEVASELLNQTKNLGCNTLIFQHTLDEVSQIMDSVKHWALAPTRLYRPDWANESTKYFRSKGTSEFELDEFIENIEEKIINLGINISTKLYDNSRGGCSQSEVDLLEMYREIIGNEEEYCNAYHSVWIDVKSILAIDVLRGPRWNCNKVQKCGNIFVTSSSRMIQVSKTYQKELSGSKAIPPCINDVVFGALVWLCSPAEYLDYETRNLLATCYSPVNPSVELLKKFWDIVDEQSALEAASDEKFLALRSFPAVNEVILKVTRGHENLVDAGTPQKVYEAIRDAYKAPLEKELSAKEGEVKDARAELSAKEVELVEVTKELNKSKDQNRTDAEVRKRNLTKRANFWARLIMAFIDIVVTGTVGGIFYIVQLRWLGVNYLQVIAVFVLVGIALAVWKLLQIYCEKRIELSLFRRMEARETIIFENSP